MKTKAAHWVRHAHLFREDEYECSSCQDVEDLPPLWKANEGLKIRSFLGG